MRIAIALLLALAGCGRQNEMAAPAADPCAAAPAGAISVQNAWLRPAEAGGTSALYAVICNKTDAADALISVSVAGAASAVELHSSARGPDGTVTMSPLDRLDVLPAAAAALAPGGAHVMLIGLADALAPGAAEDVVFAFQSGAQVQTPAIVRNDPSADHTH